MSDIEKTDVPIVKKISEVQKTISRESDIETVLNIFLEAVSESVQQNNADKIKVLEDKIKELEAQLEEKKEAPLVKKHFPWLKHAL